MEKEKRVWFNQNRLHDAIDLFKSKYDVFDFDKLMELAKTAELKEFRQLTSTIMGGSLAYSIGINNVNHLIDACNSRVISEIGRDFYDGYDKILTNCYNLYGNYHPNQTFMLFSYDFAPYMVRKAIKSTVILNEVFSGKPVSDIDKIMSVLNGNLSWDLYICPDLNMTNIAAEIEDEVFDYLNAKVRNHLFAWIDFTTCLWAKDFNSAYRSMVSNLKESGGKYGKDYF